MKSITLRSLLREPLKVKRLTRTGRTVQVTDHGEPLWIIRHAGITEDQERRRKEIERELSDVLGEPKSTVSLSQWILDSRR